MIGAINIAAVDAILYLRHPGIGITEDSSVGAPALTGRIHAGAIDAIAHRDSRGGNGDDSTAFPRPGDVAGKDFDVRDDAPLISAGD